MILTNLLLALKDTFLEDFESYKDSRIDLFKSYRKSFFKTNLSFDFNGFNLLERFKYLCSKSFI